MRSWNRKSIAGYLQIYIVHPVINIKYENIRIILAGQLDRSENGASALIAHERRS